MPVAFVHVIGAYPSGITAFHAAIFGFTAAVVAADADPATQTPTIIKLNKKFFIYIYIQRTILKRYDTFECRKLILLHIFNLSIT